MPVAPKFWLVKSEPESFSIDDLARSPGQTTFWDGVRNYQARNYLREMKLGERVLVYHSSSDPKAIVGVAAVVREAYPDHTAWDKKHPHFDAKSTIDNPTWYMVDLKLQQVFPRPHTLDQLRGIPALKDMELLRRGSRLSVQPVSKAEFEAILNLAGAQ
jgi:predicted RNA-binding protein with PUA-like domain